MNDQQRTARWLGWTPHGDDYWLIPAELDTSPLPGQQSGEPRRLPDLTTFVGCAEWCALIRAEFKRRSYWGGDFWDTDSHSVVVCHGSDELAEVEAADELAALTAVVLELMENES